jgi:hypothetical protein
VSVKVKTIFSFLQVKRLIKPGVSSLDSISVDGAPGSSTLSAATRFAKPFCYIHSIKFLV